MFEAGSLIYRIQTVGQGLFKAELAEAERAAKKTSDTLKDTAKSTKGLGDQSRLTKPRLHEITGELRGMSNEAQQASREVGGTLTAIGVGVVAMVGLTVKAAADWESAWTGVTKTVEGTPEQLQAVEDGLRDLAGVRPASHLEIAAVAEAAGQLGVKAADIVKFTGVMVDLGETTNLTSDEAATSLAQLMNIMQTAPEDVGRLGSAVVALGNDGASTERDIVQMAQRIAGAGRIVGLSEGEVLGLANALASVGIEAEAGGSSVSNIMIDISKAVSGGGEDLLEWAKLSGLSADEFGARWKAEPAEALALVIEGMGRLNDSGGDVFGTLEKLGQSDVRVTRSLLGLAGAGDLLTDSLQLGNEAWLDNLALQIEAEKRYGTAEAQFERNRNRMNELAIELGGHLLPAVVDAVEAVGDFAEGFADLPEPIIGAISVAGALVGIITLAGGAALIAVPKIAAFRTAVATLSTTMPVATGAAKGFAGFLGGPWGVALAVGVTALSALNDMIKKNEATVDQMTAAVKSGTTSAEDMFDVFRKGELITWNDDLSRLQDLLDQMGDTPNEWSTFFSGVELNNLRGTVAEFGETLAEVADSDLPAAQRAFAAWAKETDGSEESLYALLQAMPEYREQIIAIATELGVYTEDMTEAQKRQVELQIAFGTGAGQTKTATEAYLEAADATSQMDQDLQSLLDTLDEANRKNQDAISSNIDYHDAMRETDEIIRQAREGVEGYTLTLDQSTEAGARNMEALIAQAQTAWDGAQSQFMLDGSVQGLTQRLEESREALMQDAEAMGYSREQAQELADRILAMPTKQDIAILVDTRTAQQRIDGFITRYDGRRIRIGVDTYGGQTYRNEGSRISYQAEGSVRTAADGYVEPMSHQQAQMQRGGSYVVWAEDKTEGESFIPHAPSKRAQSEALLARTAALFGGAYIPGGAARMAGGGMPGSASAVAGIEDRPVTINLTVRADDPATVAALVVQNIEARARLL